MNSTVDCLDDLISIIKDNMPTKDMITCKNILKSYKGEDWKKWVKFNEEDDYTRNLVYKDDNFDMYVICWKSNQGSKFHDHAENGCILKVLEGDLLEIRKIQESKNEVEMSYIVGDISYMNNNIGVHKIINITDKQTVTLHIYSPSNYKCNIYD